jgi:ParB-like nuclease domain
MPVHLRRIEAAEQLALAYRPIAALIPYARNARTHSDAQVALIAGSIREYGFTAPILVDGDNGIIAGHGRVLAARKLGMTSVPVIELAHLSEGQRRAYILADNRLAEQAGWDRELLALEVIDHSEMAVDLGPLGFEAAEIDALLRSAETDPREEDTPEPPAVPVSQHGDLWLLGNHRLSCGSATEAADVTRLLSRLRGRSPRISDRPPARTRHIRAWCAHSERCTSASARSSSNAPSTTGKCRPFITRFVVVCEEARPLTSSCGRPSVRACAAHSSRLLSAASLASSSGLVW